MTTATLTFDDSVVLTDVSWRDYERWRLAPANFNLKMTYTRGTLEIMSPSRRHERVSYLIGRLIDVWTETHRIPCSPARATTLRRVDLDCGVEPDNCYYLEHESDVRGSDDLDLATDPVPDLVVEVEVKLKATDRLPIYAALGVPELWRWREERLGVLRLDETGSYSETEESAALPGFPVQIAVDLIARRHAIGDTDVVREFRNTISI